jgi:hypothetical protein
MKILQLLKPLFLLILFFSLCLEAKKKEQEDPLKPVRIAWHASKIGASVTVYYFWYRILDNLVHSPGGWRGTLRGEVKNLVRPWNDPIAWINPPFISFGIVTLCTFISGLRGLAEELLN